jgi:hypothetical protein
MVIVTAFTAAAVCLNAGLAKNPAASAHESA